VANALYPSGRNAGLTGNLDWVNDDFRVVLVDSGYVYSDAHDNLDDVTAGLRVATSGAMAGKSASGGVADATNTTLTAVSGDDIAGIIIYRHTGVESTSFLLAYYDSLAAGTMIDVSPDGTDITVVWSDGVTKVFKL
jgi:hydroxyethylthiazole kinase-like sugar kinase family protein